MKSEIANRADSLSIYCDISNATGRSGSIVDSSATDDHIMHVCWSNGGLRRGRARDHRNRRSENE